MARTSPLKRPSAGGRLGCLLASLRPPARAGPLPVQTGFPTSLADLVVKNHVRLKNPRRRHRPSAVPPSPSPPAAAAEQPPPPQQRREVVMVEDAVVGPKGAAFSIRPEVLAVGGAVALALLVIWSKWLVAAATVASVALFGIESVRSSASHRRPRPETTEDLVSSCGRGVVSPIREEAGESEAGTASSSSCADSDRVSEASSSLGAAADTEDLDSIAPMRKEKRRSLRKLITNKLRKGKRSKDAATGSLHGGERKLPDAGDAGVNAEILKTEPALPAPAVVDTLRPEATTVEWCQQLQGGAFPSSALVPIILVGLVAGKLPAVALTVLCAVFFSSVDRVPSS